MKKVYLVIGMLLIFGAATTFAAAGFTGQSSDASKCYYLRARYYDPETGTFISKDPLGVTAGLNSYQYVYGNPINDCDPFGLFGWWDYTAQIGSYVGGAVTAVGGAAATTAGVATSEVGVGVPVAVGGVYLMAQGGSAMASSGRNLWYMILHPNATEVPLNSSGLAGLTVSGIANLAGAENSGKITTVNADGSFSLVGTLNGAAAMVDLVTTANVGAALPAMNEAAQTAKILPGLAGTGIPASIVPLRQLGVNTELSGFGGAWDSIGAATTGIGMDDNVKGVLDYLLGEIYGYKESSDEPSGSESSGNTPSSSGDLIIPYSPGLPVGGVLLNTTATLIGQNLSDISGAMYDPVSGQFVFLGTNSPTPVKNINLDYLCTALQSVYGSAVPPFVTLVPSGEIVSSYSQGVSIDLGNGVLTGTLTSLFYDPSGYGNYYYRPGPGYDNGVFHSGSYTLKSNPSSVVIFPNDNAYASMSYAPIWPGEDTTVDVELDGIDYGSGVSQNVAFNWKARFNCVSNNLVFNHWIADSFNTTPPAGVSMSYANGSLQLANGPDFILITGAAAIPARQQMEGVRP